MSVGVSLSQDRWRDLLPSDRGWSHWLEPHECVLFFSDFLFFWWNRLEKKTQNWQVSLSGMIAPPFFLLLGKYLLPVLPKTQEITYNYAKSARNVLWSASLFWNLASVVKLELKSKKKGWAYCTQMSLSEQSFAASLLRQSFCLQLEASQHSWWKVLIWWWSQVSRRLLSLLPTRPSD